MRSPNWFPGAQSLMLLGLFSVACQEDPGAAGAGATQGGLTYWGDVAPVLNAKCVRCHQPGGIGPFAMNGFDVVDKRAADIYAKAKAGVMPPYLVTHDGSCGEFEDSETLTDAEIDLLGRWAQGPRSEGTIKPLNLSPRPTIGEGRMYKTPTLTPAPQGGTYAEFDEYRCFDGGNPLDKDAFITGYEVTPGDPMIVHHVAAMVVDPAKRTARGNTNAEQIKALDDSDPDRVGWPCFSLAGDGVELDSVPVIWAPGQGPVFFPDGLGVRHRATDQLVIQIHYNLANPGHQGRSDSTTVKLRHADTVKRRAIFTLTDPFVETVARGRPESLAPGMAKVEFSWMRTGAQMGVPPGASLEVVGVMPHMHTRGVSKQMSFTGADGVAKCAVKVDRWDFNWQKFYFYEGTRPQLTSDSKVAMTCQYDTSKDQTPVFPGWGTRNEMCIAILMLALPGL
jgi:hypothetical protein